MKQQPRAFTGWNLRRQMSMEVKITKFNNHIANAE